MQHVVLSGAYWSLASGARPWSDQEHCPHSFISRVKAASEAGFGGMGFWHSDLRHLAALHSWRDLKQILDDHGITYIEVEFLLDWFLDGERKQKSDIERDFLLDAAEGLGADHIKVGDFFREACPLDKMSERFAQICRMARERGTNILYELTPPIFSQIDNVDDALKLIRDAGEPNGGIMFDIWHVVRSGIAFEEIATKVRPTDLIAAELNDGFLAMPDDLYDATVNHRELVGQGEFDVRGFIAAVRAAGYDGHWGVEVLDASKRDLPPLALAQAMHDSTMTAFAGTEAVL